MRRPAWIFDLDGTLTVAVHDFAAMRRRLGIPAQLNILEGLDAMTAAQRAEAEREIEAWEWEHAELAHPAPGAARLLRALSDAGVRLGVLTRNLRPIALRTLEVAGLSGWFHEADILGRTDAEPKPSPAGVLHLVRRWGLGGQDAVMVGDYVHDAQAGHAAGAYTVLVGYPSAAPLPFVDASFDDLHAVHAAWQVHP